MVKLAVLPKEEKLKLTTLEDLNHNFRTFPFEHQTSAQHMFMSV